MNFEVRETANLEKIERTGFKEKEQCFLINKCRLLKTEKYMKNLTAKYKN